jgi:hypothetical protein
VDVWHFFTTSHEEVLAIANIFIALGTMVLAIGIPIAIKEAGREQRDTFYATLDQTYFEIQKLVIKNPHLSETDCTAKTPDQIIQYDAFAFIVWNFIESIHDYSKEEKALAETWGCILEYEARRHCAWFNRPENRPKFKKSFIDYIERNDLCKHADKK